MNNKGFTLIELIMIIILLGILSATAVVLVGNVLEQQKFDETLKEMDELKSAIAGNPDLIESGVRSSFGYIGDMGALPANLNGLVTNPAACSWITDTSLGGGTNLGTGAGWRGPYIEDKQDDSGNYLALLDGWGNAYQYSSGTGEITSYGPNGASGGGDDIVVSAGTTIKGTVSGRVTNPSGSPIQAPPSTYNVIVYGSPLTCPSTFRQYRSASDANGFYNITAVPIGKHKLSATVGGTTIDKAVSVIPNAISNMDILFTTAATTPSTPTGLASTVIGTSTVGLTWNAVTTNTDGSTIRDLKGYNIYRGLTASPTSLYASNVAGTSYVDSNAGYFNTYYYRITAVNTSGVESGYSSDTSEPGAYGSSSIFQTSGAATWNTTCLQFQVQNHTGSSISVTDNRMTWSGGGPVKYRIAASTASQPACPTTGTCSASGSDIATSYTLNANGGNTGYISVNFYSNAGCTQQNTDIATSNNPITGFNTNAYTIGSATNGIQ